MKRYPGLCRSDSRTRHASALPAAQVAEAARRITFGKFVNAGQTCMAPDYVLVRGRRALRTVHRVATPQTHTFHALDELSL